MALVVLLGGFLLAIILCIWHRTWGYMVIAGGAFFASFVVGLVIDGPVNWIMREDVDFSYNMVALQDGKDIHGSFFLGSGNIDSVPSFTFYVEDGDGYVLRDWPARSSRVVETSDTPHAVYTCYDYSTVPRPFRWTSKMITDDGDYYDCQHAFVTFYVPPGSVKQDITLDAQ